MNERLSKSILFEMFSHEFICVLEIGSIMEKMVAVRVKNHLYFNSLILCRIARLYDTHLCQNSLILCRNIRILIIKESKAGKTHFDEVEGGRV